MQTQAVDKNGYWDVVTCHQQPGRQTIPEPQPEFGDCFLAWLLKFPTASLFDMRRERIARPPPLQEKQSLRRERGCGEGWKTECKNLIGGIRLVMQAMAVGGQQKSKSNLASLQAYAYFPVLLFSIHACINRWYALFSQWAGLAASAE